MSRSAHICLLAQYNEWMNSRLYAAAQTLPENELMADRKAFFGSIFGTLNHLAVADTVWLKRFAQQPATFAALATMREQPMPSSLDQPLHAGLPALTAYRQWLDGIISAWAQSISESDLDQVVHYSSMKGQPFNKNLFSLLMHFFNHQTHHRGQASTLFSQLGVDIGATDLLLLVSNEALA